MEEERTIRPKGEEKEVRGGGEGENDWSRGGEGGGVVLGNAGSGNPNPGRRGGGRGEEERGIGGEETRRRGKQEERKGGGGGGAVFLAMQVLEIPAGGRGFPLVYLKRFSRNAVNRLSLKPSYFVTRTS